MGSLRRLYLTSVTKRPDEKGEYIYLRMTCIRQVIRGVMSKMLLGCFYESAHRKMGIGSPGSTGNQSGNHCPGTQWGIPGRWYLELGGRQGRSHTDSNVVHLGLSPRGSQPSKQPFHTLW